jgi:hypothetical protein
LTDEQKAIYDSKFAMLASMMENLEEAAVPMDGVLLLPLAYRHTHPT